MLLLLLCSCCSFADACAPSTAVGADDVIGDVVDVDAAAFLVRAAS